MGTNEETKVFSVNQDLCTEMYEDDTDGRAVDLAKCLLCVSNFNHTVTLDCSHTFCAPCLREFNHHASGSNPQINGTDLTVLCPTCRRNCARSYEEMNQDLILGKAAITSSEDRTKLPNHKNSNSSLETSQICDVCEFSSKSKESEAYCSKCVMSLCQTCKELHANHILFKSHPVIHISNKYSVTLFCKRHNKQQSGYYCNECNLPCCMVCILQDHVGHSSSLFMDAVTQKKEKVKAALNNLGPQLDKLESRLKKIVQFDEMKSKNDNHNHSGKIRYNEFSSQNGELDSPSADEPDLFDEMSLLVKREKSYPESSNSTPQDTPKRKRRFSIFDNEKKRPKDGNGSRKMSFFEGRRSKRGSEVSIPDRQKLGKTKNQPTTLTTAQGLEMTTVRLAFGVGSPQVSIQDTNGQSQLILATQQSGSHRAPKMGSGHQRSLSGSSSHAWHPFTRMGKSSPLLPKRTISVSSDPERSEREIRSNSMSKATRSMPPTPTQDTYLTPISLQVDTNLVAGYRDRVRSFRKLYDFAAKSLQMGHSKKLLDSYDLISQHIRSIADNEVQQIKASVREIHSEVEKAISQMTPSASMGSVDLMSGGTRKTSGASSENATVEEEHPSKELSLLIKPELVWKTEKLKGELFNRCGITFLPNGDLVVAEYDLTNNTNNRLQIFNKKGDPTRTLCEGQISPLGVTVTNEGHIAVTDSKSKRIKIITENGEVISEWGKGQFGWPHGIAVTSKGYFVVTDAFNDIISVHHTDGRRIRQFGSSGSGPNHFRNPYHVAVDRHDNIIVSDCGNNCIKVFNINGEFLFTNRGVSATAIDGLDQKNRRLKAPRGVAIDPKGNILVADDNNRVCMFDSRGKYVRNILTEDENVKYVEGIATNAAGDLALTECNPSTMIAVQAFHVYTRDLDVPRSATQINEP